jgi:hypothetical protein
VASRVGPELWPENCCGNRKSFPGSLGGGTKLALAKRRSTGNRRRQGTDPTGNGTCDSHSTVFTEVMEDACQAVIAHIS